MAPQPHSPLRRAATMFALVACGEAVFLLPFVLARVFRPTLLDVFGLTNFQLGAAFSVYGVVAMLAYFPGGPLADRFSARNLMAVSLVATSVGGGLFAAIPARETLKWLYAFWGITSILLFWAALIRATREWGGAEEQSRAYGILDAGRGLMAALLASVSVAIFASLLPVDVATATLPQRTMALGRIIWIFTGLTLGAALLAWLLVPKRDSTRADAAKERPTFEAVRAVVRMPAVWLHAVIVVCAYVGYKSTDLFSLFARDVYQYDEVAAAQIGTISFWIRPVAAVGAGLLGDRVGASRVIGFAFGLLAAGSLSIALGALQPGIHWMLVGTIAGTSACIYALRGVYFALFEEANVPLAFTGTATGLVSVIGYTPDVFMGPLTGYLLDGWPGPVGHQLVFAALAGFAMLGLAATLMFSRTVHSR